MMTIQRSAIILTVMLGAEIAQGGPPPSTTSLTNPDVLAEVTKRVREWIAADGGGRRSRAPLRSSSHTRQP